MKPHASAAPIAHVEFRQVNNIFPAKAITPSTNQLDQLPHAETLSAVGKHCTPAHFSKSRASHIKPRGNARWRLRLLALRKESPPYDRTRTSV